MISEVWIIIFTPSNVGKESIYMTFQTMEESVPWAERLRKVCLNQGDRVEAESIHVRKYIQFKRRNRNENKGEN